MEKEGVSLELNVDKDSYVSEEFIEGVARIAFEGDMKVSLRVTLYAYESVENPDECIYSNIRTVFNFKDLTKGSYDFDFKVEVPTKNWAENPPGECATNSEDEVEEDRKDFSNSYWELDCELLYGNDQILLEKKRVNVELK